MESIILVFISGLSIGVLGSFHCIGMCGPLALALPVHHLSSWRRTLAIVLYNIGRALSYASMGAVFGIIGQSFSFFKLQQWLSIVAGILILVVLLTNQFGNPNTNILTRFTRGVKSKLSTYLGAEKSTISYLSIGILNGFLPCGLVYIAVAASVATGSILNSTILMFAFGLGTFPVMALTMVFGKFISLNIRTKLTKATPYFIMFVAVLLIVRGLNLGIPYVSPTHEKGHVNCCEE